MAKNKYYPEEVLVGKFRKVNMVGWIMSTITQRNGRKNTHSTA
jgi:hypothetical protein